MDDMLGGVNASLRGSLDASLLKTGDINIGIDGCAIGDPSKSGVIGSMCRAFKVRNELKAHTLEIDWDIESARRIKREYPSWSDERCLMEARGYRLTDAQAKNLADIASRAIHDVDAKGVSPKPLDPEKSDLIVEGAKGAYSEEIKALWAALLSRELESESCCSVRTLKKLKELDSGQASLFSRMCTYCAGGHVLDGGMIQVIPLVFKYKDGTTYNGGDLSYSELVELERIGLIKLNATTYFEAGQSPLLRIGDLTYVIAHPENRISIGDIVLTSCGEEISALCQLGSADGLLDLLIERMAEQDAFLVEMPDRFAVNKVSV